MMYHSKILLFGEYTVIQGSDALAVPFTRFAGRWRQGKMTAALQQRQQQLPAFAGYLDRLTADNAEAPVLDVEGFRKDLTDGWYFASNIPTGYGLGSSGALCAGVYDRYATEKMARDDFKAFPRLKRQLAMLESFFHGSSSGTDPLISYLDHPVLLLQSGAIESPLMPPLDQSGEYHFFLLDTGIQRQTGPLVELYMENCRNAHYTSRINSRLVPQTNSAIEYLIAGQWSALFERWEAISRYQFELFPDMIPESFRSLWQAGLNSDVFKLKLCGAGGGGYLLGYTRDWYLTQTFFQEKGLIVESFSLD